MDFSIVLVPSMGARENQTRYAVIFILKSILFMSSLLCCFCPLGYWAARCLFWSLSACFSFSDICSIQLLSGSSVVAWVFASHVALFMPLFTYEATIRLQSFSSSTILYPIFGNLETCVVSIMISLRNQAEPTDRPQKGGTGFRNPWAVGTCVYFWSGFLAQKYMNLAVLCMDMDMISFGFWNLSSEEHHKRNFLWILIASWTELNGNIANLK